MTAKTEQRRAEQTAWAELLIGSRVTVRDTFGNLSGPGTIAGWRWRAPNPYGFIYPVFHVQFDDGTEQGGFSADLLEWADLEAHAPEPTA